MAVRGARAAAGDAGDRISRCHIADDDADRLRGISPGPEGDRLRRGRERGDRIPLGRQSSRSTAGAGGRIGSPTGRRDRHGRRACGARGQGGNHDDPNRLRGRRRSGQARSCRQPRAAWRQPDRVSIFSRVELAAKRLELLRELVPGAVRVAVLVNPANAAVPRPR